MGMSHMILPGIKEAALDCRYTLMYKIPADS